MAESTNNEVIGFIANTIETMRDQMATKEDVGGIDGKVGGLSDKLDAATTAIRGDIEQVHLRLNTMEHSLSSRFEPSP